MYNLFKSKNPLIRILIPVIATVLYTALPEEIILNYKHDNDTLLYSLLLTSFGTKYFVIIYKIVAALTLSFNAIFFSQMLINIKFFKTFDIFHGFIFLFLTAPLIQHTDTLSLMLSVSFFLIGLYMLMKTLRKKYALLDIFNTGVLTALASLFRFEMIWYFPFILIGLMILRSLNLREWAVAFLGLLIPYFIGISLYYFIKSDFNIIFDLWDHITFSEGFPALNLISIIALGISVFFSLTSSLKIFGEYRTQDTDYQDYLRIFFLIFLVSAVFFILIPNMKFAALYTSAVAFTIPLSVFFRDMKRPKLREILFDVFLISIILCNIDFFQSLKFPI